jgi:hypothetical protein
MEVEGMSAQDIQRVRGEIQRFEDNFFARHGRKPTKEDLAVRWLSAYAHLAGLLTPARAVANQAIDEDGDARRSSRMYENYRIYGLWKRRQAEGKAAPSVPPANAVSSKAKVVKHVFGMKPVKSK